MIIRPILYSTPMVQAVIDNLKNQTRRTKGLENINKNPDCWVFKNTSTDEKNRYFHFEKEENKDIKSFFAICPYGKTDDILWVRESFCGIYQKDNSIKFHYKADASLVFDKALKIFWKPSIHMPKIAARIFLKITDVRVE